MKIEIREMQTADWPFVAEIYKQGMDTNLATFQSECPTYEQWNQSHLKACRLVISADCTIAGWAALTPVSSRCVYAGVAEVSIYVSSAVRRNGLGKQLLSALISASEQEGVWTLQSGIMQDNISSIRLHEACGFRMVGYREKIGRDRLGIWRNTVLMERRSPANDVHKEGCSCCQK